MEIMTRRTAMKFGAVALAAPAVLTIEGCPTAEQWFQTIEADLPTAVSIVESILSIASIASGNGGLLAAAMPAITTAANETKIALTAVQNAIAAYNGGKGTGTINQIAAAVGTAQTAIQSIVAALPAGSVNPETVAALVAAAGTLTVLISSIALLVPTTSSTASASARVAIKATGEKVTLPSAGAIATGLNAVYASHGFGNVAVQ